MALLALLGAALFFALSNRIYAGHFLILEIPFPDTIVRTLGVFRSSGRFFWSVGYTVMAAAILIHSQSSYPGRSAVLLAVACGLQIVDTAPLRTDIIDSAAASPPLALAHDPVQALEDRSRAVLGFPSYGCVDQAEDSGQLRLPEADSLRQANMQFQLAAARARVPTNSVYRVRLMTDCVAEGSLRRRRLTTARSISISILRARTRRRCVGGPKMRSAENCRGLIIVSSRELEAVWSLRGKVVHSDWKVQAPDPWIGRTVRWTTKGIRTEIFHAPALTGGWCGSRISAARMPARLTLRYWHYNLVRRKFARRCLRDATEAILKGAAIMRPDGELRLAIRRWLPESMKRHMRLVRLALSPIPPSAPSIPQLQLNDCVICESRLAMLDMIPKGLVACEVGSASGVFAREILGRCRPKSLHAIDIDVSGIPAELLDMPNFFVHKGLSHAMLGLFQDEEFDFIYIDADHSYAAVCNDINAAVPKLKPNGLLAFNDFGRIVRPGFGTFGVHQAVCEFAVRSGWAVVYFCLNGEALYDVVLRKPD